jgi:glycosyltransferase involved in cell wall biosynthesis
MKISSYLKTGASIIIPTWNNFKYVKACVESIEKYSYFQHEIILHINEGVDGTLDFFKNSKFKFTLSNENIGVCKSMNEAYKLASKDIIFYFNDDMFALPDWDLEIYNFCENFNIPKEALISSTMIEPRDNNPCCLAPYNYGTDIESFNLKDLLKDLPELKKIKTNMNGSTWPPNMMHKDLWNKINGYSEEFSPGFGSDPDIAKKLYDIGVRYFIGVGSSLIYHFMCKTTACKNFYHNNGEFQFYHKHGLSINDFVYHLLQRGTPWTPS